MAAYRMVKPLRRATSWADTPAAPRIGSSSRRWLTTPARPVAAMRRTSSPVPKVPFPAAHQTLIP